MRVPNAQCGADSGWRMLARVDTLRSGNAALNAAREAQVAKGQIKPAKTNKPKVTTKEKQANKALKKEAKS